MDLCAASAVVLQFVRICLHRFKLPRGTHECARAALFAALAALVGAAGAQPAKRLPRVALVEDITWRAQAFIGGLRDFGYVDGLNIIVLQRSAEGHLDRLPQILQEVVAAQVDIIATTAVGAQAAQQMNVTIPIVGVINDPIELGIASALAKPGRNFAGLTANMGGEMIGKRLQLLKELVPHARRVVMLDFKYVDAKQTPGTHARRRAAQEAARTLGLDFVHVGAETREDFEPAFAAIKSARADVLLVVDNPVTWDNGDRIIAFANRERLPAIFEVPGQTQVGALVGYGTNQADLWRRVGGFVDKILKGAKPGDLPFEQPTKYTLAINQRVARTLGLDVPRSVLLRADLVVD